MRLVVVTLLLGLAATTAHSQEAGKWLCVADAATGFSFDWYKKTWDAARFNVDTHKYILQRSEKGISPSAQWVVTRLGDKRPDVYCANDFDGDHLSCRGMTKFEFSKTTLRFQRIYDFGYVDPLDKEGSDTPAISIGRCTPL
ncbi:hypothetical protein [Bosea sp. NPDC055594]